MWLLSALFDIVSVHTCEIICWGCQEASSLA